MTQVTDSECLHRAKPSRLAVFAGGTLLELLRFYASSYVKIPKLLTEIESELNVYELIKDDEDSKPEEVKEYEMTDDEAKRWEQILRFCQDLCEKIGLSVCVRHSGELLQSLKQKSLRAEQVRGLRDNVERELATQYFVGIPQNRQNLYRKSLDGWTDVAATFPSSSDDISEMNKCFALCRYPAAVFHSLLVVEHGLVAFGKEIGVTDPKEGWDASCRKLEQVVKDGRDKNPTRFGFEALQQLNAALQAMKQAWRNKVNHATGKPVVLCGGFAPDVAEEIISSTRGFMRRLAQLLA